MTLLESIDAYAAHKHANGISFDKGHSTLIEFGRHAGIASVRDITSQQVLAFLDSPRTSTPTWRGKYGVLKHFFGFWIARGEAMRPVLMPVPRAPVRQAFFSYIYTREEVNRLLQYVGKCQSYDTCTLDAQTLRMVLLTSYATGALLGEVLRLSVADLDLKKSMMTFHGSQFGRTRKIPLCKDICSILAQYLSAKQRGGGASRVFTLKNGDAISSSHISVRFQVLRRIAGIAREAGSTYQPRVHDLRHTFAVHRITCWIKRGADMNRMLPALAAYMGFAGLTATERYLSLTPERFRKDLEKLSPNHRGRRWRDRPDIMRFVASL
jgi:integrase/recombinase XerD